jgi:hypothetical protein
MLLRPAWPYLLGGFGGGAIAFGALALLCGVLGNTDGPVALGGLLMCGGVVALAIAWTGSVVHGHRVIGGMLGTFALGLALLVAFAAPTGDRSMIAAFSGLALFALGHMFVDPKGVRIIALPATATFALGVVVCAAHIHISAGSADALLAASLLALATLGVAVTIALPMLRARPVPAATYAAP